ncbi:lysophospholipid acyltransferase family protein [bacterium]|nr:lysophospholipid acyltransferase family protein [bacterium]
MPPQVQFGYALLRRFVRFWINRFFRRIRIQGTANIPEGPVIFAMNHPNNFIDSLMISYAIERKIHYLATSQMFRNKLLALFLHNSGVIPVYRKQDDAAHSEKNIATFQACYDVLKEGGAIGIYPEGTTHSEPRVKRIKTGAARIALETEKQFSVGVKIVPVGLNFFARKSFRGEVLVSIGAPLKTQDYIAGYLSDPVVAVEQLTTRLQDAMEEEILHVDAPELDQLVNEIAEIYRGELIRDLVEVGMHPEEVDRFRVSKKLVDGIHFFNKRDPVRLRKVQDGVRLYQSRLRKAHLQDSLLHQMVGKPASYGAFLVRVVLLLISFPLALWGGINHFLPFQITRWITRKIAKKETDYATTRILSGIVFYTLFYVAQIYWVLREFGPFVAAIYGGTLPLFGAFAYYYWDKIRIISGDLQLFWMMLTRKRLLEQLQQMRAELIAEMDQAKEDYLQQLNGAQAEVVE